MCTSAKCSELVCKAMAATDAAGVSSSSAGEGKVSCICIAWFAAAERYWYSSSTGYASSRVTETECEPRKSRKIKEAQICLERSRKLSRNMQRLHGLKESSILKHKNAA